MISRNSEEEELGKDKPIRMMDTIKYSRAIWCVCVNRDPSQVVWPYTSFIAVFFSLSFIVSKRRLKRSGIAHEVTECYIT